MIRQKRIKYSDPFENELLQQQLTYGITQIIKRIANENEQNNASKKENVKKISKTFDLNQLFTNDEDLEQQLIEATIKIEKLESNPLKRKQSNINNLEPPIKKYKITNLTWKEIDIVKSIANINLQDQSSTNKYKNSI